MKTKTKNIISGCILVLLICYVVFFIIIPCISEQKWKRIALDNGSISGTISQGCFLLGAKILHEEWQEEIQGMTNWDSMEINKKIYSYYIQCLQEDPDMDVTSASYQRACKRNPRMTGHDYFCDHWGSPVCFMHINSTEHTKLHPRHRAKVNIPLVYWSVGPNKINEYGYGDDHSL